jgi:hypothetical protein
MVDVWCVDFVTGQAWVMWENVKLKHARKLVKKWSRADAMLVLRSRPRTLVG